VFNEWAVRNPDRLKELVVVNHPDLWVVSGYRALPNRSVFDGVESVETLDLPEVLRDHQAYWATIDRDAIEPAIEHNEIMGAYLHNWLRHSSKVANNLGVLLAEEGRNDLAATCYREARRIEPANISALLNLYALSQSMPLADHAEIEAEFETFLEELPQRIGIWALSWYYGFVRHPEAYVDRGMAWAMTARKGLAMQDLRRAMDLAEDDTRMQLTLAGLHLAEQDMDASEKGYRKVLLSEPENRAALIGLVRVDILRGNFDAGRNRLQQLGDQNPEKRGALLMEWVALESMMGRFDAAREKVDQALEENPSDVTAITGLAFIAARQKDDATVEECIIKLRENVRLPAHVHLSFIQLLASMGRVDEAIHELNTLLVLQPHNLSAMEYLLNLEVRQRNRERALELVTRLLKIDPRNAYANLVMGSIQFSKGALNFSESYFVQSLESSRSPEAMNSLAYIMAQDGRSLRASLLAEESLQMRPDNPNTLDTLGLAKFVLGELDAAEKAIRRSLELQPNVGETLFHLAQVYAEQGKREEAREICRDLARRMNEFPFSEHARMRDFFSTLE
jgi:tetratricopeptide (TPR) repeat protein